jgi:hypothetical protein
MADTRLPEVHPTFEPVLAASAGEEVIAFGKMLVSSGLKVNGKFFAFSQKTGSMVVKLPKARVTELVDAGLGERFQPANKPMKEWLVVLPGALDWVDLAREAHAFVKLGAK